MSVLIILCLMAVLMVLYGYHALRLMKLLEHDYPEKLEKMNFPKKMGEIFYCSTFKTGGNFIRFVYSNDNFNNPEIARLKSRIKLIILLSGIWLVSFVIYCRHAYSTG
ncbi:MAG: hypothetical protein ISS92_06425 [Candidatus Omnitrophica bacterium]|nr:hypothetical protein [Candidatus Omnitrophota bacterium]